MPFSFFVRVILEGDYSTVVEIGSYDGRRIINIKKLFENIRAYGLDIHNSYINPRNLNDVDLLYFNLDFFRSEKIDKPLLIAAHTFQYMDTEKLVRFLKILFEQNYDIAFSTHASPFARESTLRRTHKSYYHPYEKILRDIGYTVNSEQFRHNLSSSYIERLYYYYATRA